MSELNKLIDSRQALVLKKREIELQLLGLKNRVRGHRVRRLPNAEYQNICERQSALAEDLYLLERAIASVTQRIRGEQDTVSILRDALEQIHIALDSATYDLMHPEGRGLCRYDPDGDGVIAEELDRLFKKLDGIARAALDEAK